MHQVSKVRVRGLAAARTSTYRDMPQLVPIRDKEREHIQTSYANHYATQPHVVMQVHMAM
jgi:hypothetical protein